VSFQKVFLTTILGAACICLAGSAEAAFTLTRRVGGNIGLGDWTGPSIRFVDLPENSLAEESLNLNVQATDAHSPINSFEYILYSGEHGDADSDWIISYKNVGCADGTCDSLAEAEVISFSLDEIENPNHKLCSTHNQWCLNQPLPDGVYFAIVRVYDKSKTISPGGNASPDLIYRFEKISAQIICGLPDTIRAKAGEGIQFPNISCAGEPALAAVVWDIDERDGINFDTPDASGNEPVFEEGFRFPGSYTAHVRAVNEKGMEKIKSFTINIENPSLVYGDILINEFMPDPSGDDLAVMPDGEWVEIYNKLDLAVDVTGFVIYDGMDSHPLSVSAENIEDGGTILFPRAYKVIYRNGHVRFSLNNTGPERVRLVDGFLETGGLLLNESQYVEKVPEGQSRRRIPDHVGDFGTGLPSKGSDNDQVLP